MKFIGPNGEPNSVDLRCATDFETLLEAVGWASRVLIGAESAFRGDRPLTVVSGGIRPIPRLRHPVDGVETHGSGIGWNQLEPPRAEN